MLIFSSGVDSFVPPPENLQLQADDQDCLVTTEQLVIKALGLDSASDVSQGLVSGRLADFCADIDFLTDSLKPASSGRSRSKHTGRQRDTFPLPNLLPDLAEFLHPRAVCVFQNFGLMA